MNDQPMVLPKMDFKKASISELWEGLARAYHGTGLMSRVHDLQSLNEFKKYVRIILEELRARGVKI
jgi:hypothetical protein